MFSDKKEESNRNFGPLKVLMMHICDASILQIHVLCGWNKDANELVQSFLTSHVQGNLARVLKN